MKLKFKFTTTGVAVLAVAGILAFASAAGAQGTTNPPQQTPQQNQQQTPATPTTPSTAPSTSSPGQATPLQPGAVTPSVPKIDPAEESAYKSFMDLDPDTKDTQTPNSGAADRDKQIQLGEAFVAKYPSSKYDLRIYSQLVQDYYHKNDMDKMYAAGDKALALDPDDIAVLVLVGWVIPHTTGANTPDGSQKLDQAEKYEKHALEVLPTTPKPENITDDQFAKVKVQAQSEAHSALGLIYFRRQDFANSIAELQQGTSTAATPDPTDYFVMGRELEALKRTNEAVDAYQKCVQIPGPLMNTCKQLLDKAKQDAAAAPATPKQ